MSISEQNAILLEQIERNQKKIADEAKTMLLNLFGVIHEYAKLRLKEGK